ncbi:MAG: aminotransferase class V-fold PLP-dependent enzyme [Candidatus Xenobium sp.]|jgi:cysteine desulfurase/selenocysteine lyase|nr:aminotransferase class V-fold PLP-dependent enzyme [Burkholderiales bacterium]
MTFLAPKLGERTLFPNLEARAYLAHAGISPASRPVQEAVAAVLDAYSRRGAGALMEWLPVRERLRQRLARLIQTQPQDLALVPNTTQGVLNIALCFPWKPGDRVLIFQGEFPANVTPWMQAGVEVSFLPLPRVRNPEILSTLEAELSQGVRLVAVSAVQFQTGLAMPLQEMGAMCRRYGAALFVDAIQAAGVVPLDVQGAGIDFLTCGSHKWLMGMEGSGFLYVSPEWVGKLRPRMAGWLSHEDPLGFLSPGGACLDYQRPIRKRADFLEPGTGNLLGHVALEASVALIEELGVPAIHAHVNSYLDALEQGLGRYGFASLRSARRSGILSVLPPSGWSLGDIHRGLARRGIICSTPDGFLRFAPHWPNHRDEVPFVLAAVDEILRQGS